MSSEKQDVMSPRTATTVNATGQHGIGRPGAFSPNGRQKLNNEFVVDDDEESFFIDEKCDLGQKRSPSFKI